MSEPTFVMELPFSREQLWWILHEAEVWIPVRKHYIDHEVVNDREIIWTFLYDMGMMKKRFSVKTTIVKWDEPERLLLYVTDMNEKFHGEVMLELQEIRKGCTIVSLFQNIQLPMPWRFMLGNVLSSHIARQKLIDRIEEVRYFLLNR